MKFSELDDPNNFAPNCAEKDADYIAPNGDRYFSVDDFWVVVTYDGPNLPRSIRIEPKGEVN